MTDYADRRRAQRIRLRMKVIVEGTTPDGASFQVEATTVDLSPIGAAIEMPFPVPTETAVTIEATLKSKKDGPFRTEAVVRHNYFDKAVAGAIIGVEYTGEPIPVVSWG